MQKVNYQQLIAESNEELLQLERKATQAINRDRLRFLRLLKSGAATTLPAAGALVNFKKSWCYELWHRYTTNGIAALQAYPFCGTHPKLTAQQQQQLKDSLSDDGIATLSAAAQRIREQSGVQYSTSGTWYVLRSLGIKKKTGRPCHFQQDAAAAEAFKKKPRP